MSEALAITILVAAGVYAAVGAAFAAWLVTGGMKRLDPAAAHGPIGFRVIIVPGVVALWPVLAVKVLRGRPRDAGARAEGAGA